MHQTPNTVFMKQIKNFPEFPARVLKFPLRDRTPRHTKRTTPAQVAANPTLQARHTASLIETGNQAPTTKFELSSSRFHEIKLKQLQAPSTHHRHKSTSHHNMKSSFESSSQKRTQLVAK
ncbi:hypothetical protein Droror1_Dr00020672 [Drosera rotundifolia]